MAKKDKKAWRAYAQTRVTYDMIFNELLNLALSRFEWLNLPPTVDERFMELVLHEMGYILYFDDEIIGNLALTCTIGGKLDVYRIPIMRRAFATNGYNKLCSKKDSVLMFNNRTHTPTLWIIEEYAKRLTNIQMAIDINVNAQKTPLMILCEETQRLTMMNLYEQYDGNAPYIFGNKELDMEGVRVLKTDAPTSFKELQVQYNNTMNQFCTRFGIENSNQDKKERMVTDEVNANQGMVESERMSELMCRKDACKKINVMFGTDLDVRFRSELISKINIANVSRETIDSTLYSQGKVISESEVIEDE